MGVATVWLNASDKRKLKSLWNFLFFKNKLFIYFVILFFFGWFGSCFEVEVIHIDNGEWRGCSEEDPDDGCPGKKHQSQCPVHWMWESIHWRFASGYCNPSQEGTLLTLKWWYLHYWNQTNAMLLILGVIISQRIILRLMFK